MIDPLLLSLATLLLLLIAAVVFAVVKRSVSSKGSKMERRLGNRMLQLAKENDYLCLNHVCIKIDDFFIHIPSLVIGNKYFYYLDPLDIKGTISGKDIDRKWLVNQASGTQHLDNPIKKSDLLIQVLVDLLKVNLDDFINICVVGPNARIGDFQVTRNNAAVIYEKDVSHFIVTTEKEAKVNVYRTEDIEFIAAQLYEIHKKSLAQKKQSKGKMVR